MTLFTPAEIADLRALDESAMLDTCTIYRVVEVDDNAGAWTESVSTSSSICRIESTTSGVQVELPVTTEIAAGDRVVVAGRLYGVRSATVVAGLATRVVADLIAQTIAVTQVPLP